MYNQIRIVYNQTPGGYVINTYDNTDVLSRLVSYQVWYLNTDSPLCMGFDSNK